MAKTQYGTDTITGLNVGTAPHKIQPHELQESVNGWTEQEGAWRVADGPERLYSGYVDISSFAAGRMGGADHLVWTDDDKLYDNDSEIGALTEGSEMKTIALDDKFLVLGGAVNYLYDEDHIREQGCWQPDDIHHLYLQMETPAVHATNISGVTKASPGVVTLTAHGYETGDWIYIDALTEMTELNGRKFLVTKIDANSFSINEDTGEHGTAETSATGTAKRYAGLDGVYRWYLTCTVELASGRVLESRPRGLRLGDMADTGGTDVDSWEASSIAMTTTDLVFIGQDDIKQYGYARWVDDSVQNFKISGTIGTDYFPGLRIYRTKADGTDFYLEREYRHGDTNLYFTGGVDQAYFFFHDGTGDDYGSVLGADDKDLGAVYTASSTDHSNPPDSLIGVTVGQRLFINDVDNSDRYWWSHLDGIEYYNPLDWNTIPDTITGMAQLDNKLVIFSQDRIFVDYFTGGLPDVQEIRTDTGSATGIIVTTDDGVMFLEEDGLWLFDGARVSKISRRGFETIDTPKSICATGDMVYISGEYDGYTVRQRDGGMVWHQGGDAYPFAATTGGSTYVASAHDISQMFVGAQKGGKLTTSAFSAGTEVQVDRVILDIEGPTVPLVWVNGNRQSDDIPHCATATDEGGTRRRVWIPIPQLSNHVFSVTIETTGGLTVYGIWVEAVR